MDLTALLQFASFAGTTWNIFLVAIGLGLVIFFHELGHFAVAKWCNVYVERFSIGFGPVLFSWQWGETEYALSLIPFGGYVKMLGQDDMDPSQLSSDEIAEDPRAYSAKSVPQRMAIISAGVIMNIVTGMLFYATAFGIGVQAVAPVAGATRVGMPAWQAGMRTGDEILEINGNAIETFTDITYNVALSDGEVEVRWRRPDGTEVTRKMLPDGGGTHRRIGVEPARGTSLIQPDPKSGIEPTMPGTPAANADLRAGDRIVQIADEEISSFAQMQEAFNRRRDETVTVLVQREGEADGSTTPVEIGPNRFRTLGLWMEIGEIAAVRRESPAARAGLNPGDRITKIDGEPLSDKINPMMLPDMAEEWARDRRTVELTVLRKGSDKPEPVEVTFEESDPVLLAWSDQPNEEDSALSVPSLGLALHLINKVITVEPESPAEEAGIKRQDRLIRMTFTLAEGAVPDHRNENKPIVIEFTKDKGNRPVHNWVYAFWTMQVVPTRDVQLTVADKDGERTVDLAPARADDWSVPFRGIHLDAEFKELKATGPLSALSLGYLRAKTSMFQVYKTIASLVGGRVSYKELAGPVSIAKVAYTVADRGVPDLLMFLGFLSINLAVLNFLPIPVLDGGHMVFLIWEAVTRRKPSERVVVGATYVGFAFILGLMGLVLYLDIFVHP